MPPKRRSATSSDENRKWGSCTLCLKTTHRHCFRCGPICQDCSRSLHREPWLKFLHPKPLPLDYHPPSRSHLVALKNNHANFDRLSRECNLDRTLQILTTPPSSPDGSGLGRIVGHVGSARDGPIDTQPLGATIATPEYANDANPSTTSTPRLSTESCPRAARLLSWRLTNPDYLKPPSQRSRPKGGPKRCVKPLSSSGKKKRKPRVRSFSEEESSYSQNPDDA